MRLIALTFVVFLLGSTRMLEAQRLVMESKAAVSFSYTRARPLGKAEVTNNAFTFPALLANMQPGNGLSVQYSQKLAPLFSGGIRYARLSFAGWQFVPPLEVFNQAEVSVTSVSLPLMLKSKFSVTGLLNKLRVFTSVAPGISFVNARFPNQLNEQVDADGNARGVYVSSSALRPGFSVGAGIEYALTTSWALTFDGGLHYAAVKSKIYQEKAFQWFQLNGGLSYRMQKNKNYLRTPYD